MAVNPLQPAVATLQARLPVRFARWGVLGLAVIVLSGCAQRSCADPYVLDFLDNADRQADLAHVGLVRSDVRSAPGATPDRLSCSIWEQIRPPGTRQITLRAQYYELRHVSDGWQLTR